MLNKELKYRYIKIEFDCKFRTVLQQNDNFRKFMFDVFVNGSAYVVGGFLRDILLNRKSRDLDMIVDVSSDTIAKLLCKYDLVFNRNRHNGFKIDLVDFEVDLWSITDNWAFKNSLVKWNKDYILDRIAKGCFYNYDSLVINVHTKNMSIRYYLDFIENYELDILQKSFKYKLLNPSIEANILRAIFLFKKFEISFSDNCLDYLVKRIEYLNIEYKSSVVRILNIKKKYPKYDSINKTDIIYFINFISDLKRVDQTKLNF